MIKSALKYLEPNACVPIDMETTIMLVNALKEALAQRTEQKPCGWQFYQDGKWHNGTETNNHRANTEHAGIPVRDVYPAPQRTWVGLTEQEALDCFSPNPVTHSKNVEAKLKEKNT